MKVSISIQYFYLKPNIFCSENKDKKSKKSDKSEERLDLPIGDDLDSAISRRKVAEPESESSKSYKTQNSNGRVSGKKGRRS